LNTGLSGVADGLGIDSGNALNNLACDLSDLLGLHRCDALGDLHGGFRNGRCNGGCNLRGGGWCHRRNRAGHSRSG
jgi:hypothetical protein